MDDVVNVDGFVVYARPNGRTCWMSVVHEDGRERFSVVSSEAAGVFPFLPGSEVFCDGEPWVVLSCWRLKDGDRASCGCYLRNLISGEVVFRDAKVLEG